MTGSTRAFTLVEILAAVAILVLVLSAVFALYQTAIRAYQRVEQQTRTASAANGLGQLLRDLACAAAPENESACSFRLESEFAESGAPAWRLTFCSTTPIENPTAPRWYGIESVVYRWSPEQPSLVRIAAPLEKDLKPPVTNIVVEHVEELRIRFFDGLAWQASWTSSPLPRAAQVVWREAEQTFTAETFVAAGMVFTSSVARAPPR